MKILKEASVEIPKDMLNNPSDINIKDLAKQAFDKEAEEKKQAELLDRRMKAKEKAADIIKEVQNSTDKLDTLFDLLVPAAGKAETKAGEAVRAMMRILYRDYNDGDVFYEGYGLDTAGSSAEYLMDNYDILRDSFTLIVDKTLEEDDYTEAIETIAKQLVQYLIDNPELFYELNEDDSREWSTTWLEDHRSTYDFDGYIPETISDNLTDTEIRWELESWEIPGHGMLKNISDNIYYHNGSVYIEGIYKDVYDELQENWDQWVEQWADDVESDIDVTENLDNKKKTYHITNIEWDIWDEELKPGQTKEDFMKQNNLPTEFDITVDIEPNDDEIEVLIDAISDKYGFTHNGFNYVEVEDKLNEEILKLKDVVKDSHRHFTHDLGRTPNVGEIVSDIANNYEGYSDIEDTPEHYMGWTSAIQQELNRQGLPYKEDEEMSENLSKDISIKESATEDIIKQVSYPAKKIKVGMRILVDPSISTKTDIVRNIRMGSDRIGDYYTFDFDSGTVSYRPESLVKVFATDSAEEGVADESLKEDTIDYVFDILVDGDPIDLYDYTELGYINTIKEARIIKDKVKADYPNSKIEINKHSWDEDNNYTDELIEGTVKQGNAWVNKGKEGTHGKFRTKKAADAQRKAMFANGFKEDLENDDLPFEKPTPVIKKSISDIEKLEYNIRDLINILHNEVIKENIDPNDYYKSLEKIYNELDNFDIDYLTEKKDKKSIKESISELDEIKIPGYTNTWSSIDDIIVNDKHYYLMENDEWGDETWYLVITPDFKEIYETYDDIQTCLIDEGILDNYITESTDNSTTDCILVIYEDETQKFDYIDNYQADSHYAELNEKPIEELEKDKIIGFAHLIKNEDNSYSIIDKYIRDDKYKEKVNQYIEEYTSSLMEENINKPLQNEDESMRLALMRFAGNESPKTESIPIQENNSLNKETPINDISILADPNMDYDDINF